MNLIRSCRLVVVVVVVVIAVVFSAYSFILLFHRREPDGENVVTLSIWSVCISFTFTLCPVPSGNE